MIANLKPRILTIGAALIATEALLGAGALAVTKTVNVENFDFSPATVRITPGDTVKWVWVSGLHSTTSGTCSGTGCSPDGKWNSGIKSSGQFTHTFDTSGNYPYYCGVHLSAMTGMVIVSAPGSLAAKASASGSCGGPPPLQTTFTGGASGGHSPYTFLWDFGDGSPTSTEQNPVHSYDVSGTYSATLQARDADGTVDDATVPIDVRSMAVPVVTKMKKLTSPFRLVVLGTGFGPHSTILINDQPVPLTRYRSGTKLVALKGAALKAMVPLNQEVTVTVRDDDANVTGCPHPYMRMPASMAAMGGGGGMGY